MNKTSHKLAGHALAALGHLSAVFAIAVGVALLILPLEHVQGVATQLSAVDRLWDLSAFAVFLHVGLAACLWALSYILFQFARLRAAEQKVLATVKLRKGSVMTETLVVLPIYLILTFGMAQLAINNIAGILANLAAYEAARAAWVWQPEAEAGRMGTTPEIAVEKCRIAVAFVMMPVAPGDFLKISGDALSMGDYADKARMLAVGANIPGAGIIATNLPPAVLDFAEGVVAGVALGDKFKDEHSYAVTLDSSGFITRTVRKFTQAYLGSNCEIGGDHSVTMTYKHLNSMPVVGRIFGSGDIVGGVIGNYSTYTRNFGFTKQLNTPNSATPANIWLDWASSDPGYDTSYDTSGYE